jgi:hypothetical protein
MTEFGPSHNERNPQRAASSEVGISGPTFVDFLKKELDAKGQAPSIPREGSVPDLTILRQFTIPSREEPQNPSRGVTITERSDPNSGVRYEVTDTSGNQYAIDAHATTAERRTPDGQSILFTDFSTLQEGIIELQKPASSSYADAVEKYGGTPDFVAKLRGERVLPKRPSRARRVIAGALAAAAIVGGGAAILNQGGESSTPSAPRVEGPAVPGPENAKNTEFEDRKEQVKLDMQDVALTSARSILDDLAKPNVGTELYDQTRIGNKKAIVGPDLEMGTPDDKKYKGVPEMFAYFDPDKNTILIRSTSMHGNADKPTFYSTDTAFKVSESNGIIEKARDGQLTIDDFQDAIHGDKANHADLLAIDVSDPNGEYGVSFANGDVTTAEGFSGQSLVDQATSGQADTMKPPPDAKKATTIDDLNVAVNKLKEQAEPVRTQLSKDASKQ